jgi:carbamoylphosphate synthase large subunit
MGLAGLVYEGKVPTLILISGAFGELMAISDKVQEAWCKNYATLQSNISGK